MMKALSDFALDTAIYGGGITSYEALYTGLPLVHRRNGWKMMQRAGGSVLSAAGLTDLIAADEKEYVRIAVMLGTDRDFARQIKHRLYEAIAGRSDAVLFRPDLAVRSMVRGMQMAYMLWQERKPPQDIFGTEAPLLAGKGTNREMASKNLQITDEL